MNKKPKGSLIIIGGHEDQTPDGDIIHMLVKKAHTGSLAIVTAATQSPEEMITQYTKTFKQAGIHKVDTVDIRNREDGFDKANVEKVQNATVIFLTGGDQLRITSQIGDSDVFKTMRERYIEGATIAGTSAGAAAMGETMIVNGAGDQANGVSGIDMVSGLEFLMGTVIDSHFAERGRIGRLLAAIAQNPALLGLGVDENTAVFVRPDDKFQIIGEGAVNIVDGAQISYSSLSEKNWRASLRCTTPRCTC